MSDALDVDEFLAHFGVKGMHWGVVHEPDPGTGRVKKSELKTDSRQAKREAIAQKYEKKAADTQSQIDKIKTRQSSDTQSKYQARADNKLVKDLTKVKDIAVSDADKKRQGKLTSTQKKVLIGTAVAAALIGTVILTKSVQSGEFRRMATKGAAFLQGRKATDFARKEFLATKNMSPDMVHKLVVKDINPDFNKLDFGARMNCRRCTFAYELRRRGFDVAATKTTTANGQNAAGLLNAMSPGEKRTGTGYIPYMTKIVNETLAKEHDSGAATPLLDLSNVIGAGAKNKVENPGAKSIFDMLSSQPDRSRGELGVKWKMGGGHSMAYEIFDGKPVIFDAQSGKKLSTIEEFAQHGLDALSEAGVTRLDNVQLDHDFLLRWVKNSK